MRKFETGYFLIVIFYFVLMIFNDIIYLFFKPIKAAIPQGGFQSTNQSNFAVVNDSQLVKFIVSEG